MSTTGTSKQSIIALYLILSEYCGASNFSIDNYFNVCIVQLLFGRVFVTLVNVKVCTAHSGVDSEGLLRLQRAWGPAEMQNI